MQDRRRVRSGVLLHPNRDPRRWVVERTFSWFGRNQRLAKDFANLAESLTTFITLASIQLALRRLARA